MNSLSSGLQRGRRRDGKKCKSVFFLPLLSLPLRNTPVVQFALKPAREDDGEQNDCGHEDVSNVHVCALYEQAALTFLINNASQSGLSIPGIPQVFENDQKESNFKIKRR